MAGRLAPVPPHHRLPTLGPQVVRKRRHRTAGARRQVAALGGRGAGTPPPGRVGRRDAGGWAPATLPGIAGAAIDAFVELAKEKTPTFSQTGLATRPTIDVEVARAEELEARRRLACANVGASCTQAVERLFTLSGSTAVYAGHRLERCLRDVRTAGQHLFFSPVWWEKTGQYYFGLGLGMP